MQNVFDKNGFEDFENTVKIWLLKYLMKASHNVGDDIE